MLSRRFEAKDGVRLGSSFLILGGTIVLLAWLLRWRLLLQLIPGGPLMTCDTALCFILAGLGLWATAREALRFSRLMGLFLVVLGAAYLDAGVQHKWFTLHSFFASYTASIVAPAPITSCRVAVATAAVFLLIGSLLVLTSQKTFVRHSLNLTAFLASSITAIGVLGAVFNLAGILDPRTWTGYLVSMSLPTSIFSIVAGIAACLLFWSRSNLSERRLSAAAATLALLGLLVLFAVVNSAVVSNQQLASETKTEMEAGARQVFLIQAIAAAIRKAEDAQRGYLLTNSDRYLQLYDAALREINPAIGALTHYPDLKTDRLKQLVNRKLAELASTIELQRAHRSAQALASIRSGQGLDLMQDLDSEATRLIVVLGTRFSQRLNQNERSHALLQKTVELSSAIAVIMILMGIAFLRMEIRRRTYLEAALRDSTRSLETKVAERTAEIRHYSEELQKEMAARKRAAGQLREAAERLRIALHFAKVAVWSWQPGEDKTVWSGAVEEVFGRSVDQISRYSMFRELIFAGDRDLVDAALKKSLQEGCDFAVEFRMVHPNGGIRWIASVGGVVLDENGQSTQMAGINMDISDRKRMEQELEVSERHFRELAEAMPQIVWTANAAGEFEYHNDRWFEVTGLPKSGIKAEDRKQVVHPEDFDVWLAGWTKAVQSGEPYEMEYRFFDKAKREYRWYWGHAVPVCDANGKVVQWYGTSTDIHERKTAEIQLAESERALRKREQQVQMLFQNGSMGDFVWDFAKNEVDAHPGVWALFGEPNGKGIGKVEWFTARYHPDDMQTMGVELQAALDGTRPLDVEYRVVWPDGTVRWLASRGVAVRDKDGKPIQMHGLGIDITDRKTAALKVEESERHFREMADAMPQIVWRSASNGDMDYCNARWYEYSGFTVEETKLLGWQGLVHADDFQRCAETLAQGFASGKPFEIEFRLRRAMDGAYRWHLARSVPYRDQDGKILRWFGAATDIHEQRVAKESLEVEVLSRRSAMQLLEVKEEQLTRSLAEKNTLLQEVHHRVKNNLQVISSLLRMQGQLLKDDTASAALKESHERVLSMALIHEQLYGNHGEMDQIDFASFSQTLASELLRSYAGTANRVTCRFNTQSVLLKIDQAIPCGLILNELVTNALKYAYPPGKRGEVLIDLTESDAGMVKLSVSDNGVGLPEGLDWNKSESMGLPIVDLLTQQLDGKLVVRSSPGAAFSIEFERDKRKATHASAA